MCGIVGAIAQRDITEILLEGLRRLEYRGYDSAGLAILADGELQRVRCPGKVVKLEEAIADAPISGTLGIAHTRWATHGVPNQANAHPHLSGSNIAVVHNGIITNFEGIKASLSDSGYHFQSDTDTEVIAHLISSFLIPGGGLINAVKQAVALCEGAYALGVIECSQPDVMVCARKGSPLVVGVGVGENYIASDQLALLQVTDRFMFLGEGDIASVTLTDVTVWDASGTQVERPVTRYEHSDQSSDKGQYRHYMEKEIHEQHTIVRQLITARSNDQGHLTIPLDPQAKNALRQAKQVLIVACGTSFFAGLVARYWIEAYVGLPCQVEVASEFRYREPVISDSTLFVTLSQSGETADTLAALRYVEPEKLVASLTICNVPSSSMVRESDFALLTQAGPEIGVASTKAFTTQLFALLQLTVELGDHHSALTMPTKEAFAAAMHELPALMQQVINLEPDIATMAEHFADKHHALFLGRGAMYPIAKEGALKLKEISYIHAEAYPAGELKHGPLALVDGDMPVVVIAPDDALLDKLKANMQEVKARGGELFVFADEKITMHADDASHLISLPPVHGLLAPILYTIPMQLLAYHVALIKGTDVDQPRNLAKSVTVE